MCLIHLKGGKSEMMESLKSAIKVIVPLIGAPAVVFSLQLLPWTTLAPLGEWEEGTRFSLVVIPTLVGSALALILPRRNTTNRNKMIALGVSFGLTLGTRFLYTKITSKPPTDA